MHSQSVQSSFSVDTIFRKNAVVFLISFCLVLGLFSRPVIAPWALRENNFQVQNQIRFSVEYFQIILNQAFHLIFLFVSHVMFYDLTDVYHVNVNNALELTNQSVHYIGLKHKPCLLRSFLTFASRILTAHNLWRHYRVLVHANIENMTYLP